LIHTSGLAGLAASRTNAVNPARSLGPAIVSADYGSIGIYLTAPFIGAAIGWFVYRVLSAEEAAGQAAD